MSKEFLSTLSNECLLKELYKRNVFIPIYFDEDYFCEDHNLSSANIKKYIKIALDDSTFLDSLNEIAKEHLEDHIDSALYSADDENLSADEDAELIYNNYDDEDN